MGKALNLDKIKVLVFDLGGVLIDLSKQSAVDKLVELGINDADQLLDDYYQYGLFDDLEDGRITARELRMQLRNDYRLTDVTDDMIDAAFRAFLLGIPETKLQLLRRLHAGVFNKDNERIRIVMLSNTNEIHFPYSVREYFEKGGHSMNEYFDRLYLSYEMKMSKPDKNIFLKLLEEENVKASECLFLDDGPKNIETAREIGFNAYLVGKNENLTPLFGF